MFFAIDLNISAQNCFVVGEAVKIGVHARERMAKYEVSEFLVREALEKPGSVVEGHSGRKIAQRKLNGYMLRVVFKKEKAVFIIVTVYKARCERYEI